MHHHRHHSYSFELNGILESTMEPCNVPGDFYDGEIAKYSETFAVLLFVAILVYGDVCRLHTRKKRENAVLLVLGEIFIEALDDFFKNSNFCSFFNVK